MRFGITLGKTVVATLSVSPDELVTNRAGEPIAYRTRTHEEMFAHARRLANGCGVYPMDKVHHHA